MLLSFAHHQQTDTSLRRLHRTLKTRVHRPLDHPPVTAHPLRGNRQDDPAKRVYKPPCVQRTSYTGVFPKSKCYVASIHPWWMNGQIVKNFIQPKPKEKWTFVNKKGKARKHRNEKRAAANKYRCMRCGRDSGHVKDKKWLCEDFNTKLCRWDKSRLEGQRWRIMVQIVLG